MNIVALMQADLEVTTLGTKSRLGAEIAGEPVLRRTVDRLRHVGGVTRTIVASPPEQCARVAKLLDGMPVEVLPAPGPDPPWRSLVRSARKWSLDGWRGGLGGAMSYDEYVDCRVVSQALTSCRADGVLCVPAAAPALSPSLTRGMIDLLERTAHDSRLIFAQSPPGLTGLLMQADLVHELAEQAMPVGWVFAYKPDTPQKDLIFMPCCFELPPELRYASGRLVVDTTRSFHRVADLLAAHPTDDPEAVGRWLVRREAEHLTTRPREVEIELTTDDPFPETLMRPRGSRVPRRGPMTLATIERAVGDLAADDDALLVVGGFGEPLMHPQFLRALELIRECWGRTGGQGLAVRTAGVHLTGSCAEAMIAHGVDVVQVLLDAWSGELYAKLQSPHVPERANLDAVVKNIEGLAALRADRRSAQPIIVPDLTKSRDNVDELEAFYDGWIREVGAVSVTGYTDRAGQCEDRRVMNMAPPTRFPCRRLRSSCVVLANGTVTPCDQDYRGAMGLGDLARQELASIWQGERFTRIRQAHDDGAVGELSRCASCSEWHRC